jgi:redox-sensing transcriptional repressor
MVAHPAHPCENNGLPGLLRFGKRKLFLNSGGNMSDAVPAPSLRRLPNYLRLMRQWLAEGRETISCTHLAESLDLDPTQVRKDLALTGVGGRPKVGYVLAELVEGTERFLGWDNASEAFLVGVGNLGAALLGYPGFARQGLSIVAGFDADPKRVGLIVAGKPIQPMGKLPELVTRMHIRLGVLTVPEAAADVAARAMVQAGIQAIWNFTGARIDPGPGIIVEHVDLAQSLAVLSHRWAAARRFPPPPTTT